ncbi:MAG: hypothetical protein IT370_05605 [Deltaproteobacteria bacterium]|nr:hypothetical protein [Deltaproteobacteria bacterium]
MDVAVVHECSLERFVRLEAGLMARPPGVATLVVCQLMGQGLLLGRYQRAARFDLEAARAAGLTLARRVGGGRALVAGQGTVGVLLAVPPGGAGLLPAVVAADKVLNRYVRGLLRGIGLLGAPAHYFGRDFVTADHRQIGRISQDGGPDGSVLFEAVVALERNLEVAPELMPGVVPVAPSASAPAPVALADLTCRLRRFDEVADQLALGYASTYGQERAAIEAPAEAPAPELSPAPIGPVGPAVNIPIGVLEAELALHAGTISAARLHGDFIATSFAIAALEAGLVGCPLDPGALAPRIDAALMAPHAAIVGLRDLASVLTALTAS